MDQKYYIVKEPGEELHQVLVADTENGKVKAMSKVQPDKSIKYKVFMESINNKTEVLAEGIGSNEEYQRVINDLEVKLLSPHGGEWQEVQPTVIENKPECQ
ncbi:MAG: hypothetical protein FH758_12860 [Firmicutes bacterium]|nr:hypothetical protein [Bacillota bacterium]